MATMMGTINQLRLAIVRRFMDWLAAAPIGTRLKAAFAVLCGFLLVLSALAVLDMIRIFADLRLNVTRTQLTESVQNATSTVHERSSAVFSALQTVDDFVFREEQAGYTDYSQRFTKNIQDLDRKVTDPSGRELLEEIIEHDRTMTLLIDRAFSLREQNRMAEASVILVRGVRPEQQQIIDRLTRLASLQSDASKADLARAEAGYHMALLVFAFLNLFALFAALLAARLLLRSINQPLGDLLMAVRRVEDGDLDFAMESAGTDEIAVLSQSFGRMVDSVRTTRQELERYATRLEELVEERTAELRSTMDYLSASHEETQQLKLQQDGDYFLTSLLVRPLSGNFARPGTDLSVDMLIHQKKQFRFRKWNVEIGGDICIAHSIQLKNGGYLVIANADAMGKSLQGAGGAVVFGTVFRALIDRTIHKKEMRELYAEQWLYQCYLELQSVFTAFDGNMCTSALVGLIHESTGVLHFFNADHPRPVLYRDGRAEFVESPLILKLGLNLPGTEFQMRSLCLGSGDCLILGSDGRDDLVIGSDQAGQRVINEDETTFLSVVESAAGEPERIRRALESMGHLSDDLSLLSVRFLGSALKDRNQSDVGALAGDSGVRELADLEAAHAGNPANLPISRRLGKQLLRANRHAEAAEVLAGYCREDESRPEYLYYASVAHARAGLLQEARDYGERCRIRMPALAVNLANLAGVYLSLRNKERAVQLVQMALAHEPQNPEVLKMARRVSPA